MLKNVANPYNFIYITQFSNKLTKNFSLNKQKLYKILLE